MKVMFRCLFVFLSAALLGGCFSYQPTYVYEAQEDDAKLIFESDYDAHTYFQVMLENLSDNKCRDYKDVGYIKNIDSFLVSGATVKSFEVSAPANQEIVVSAVYRSGNVSCGPLQGAFTPEANKTYLLRMISEKNQCRFIAYDQGENNKPVLMRRLPRCTYDPEDYQTLSFGKNVM